MKNSFMTVLLGIGTLLSFCVQAQSIDLKNWPEKADPMNVGRLVAQRFVESPHNSFKPPAPPRTITYPEVCTWYGALKFAEVSRDKALLNQLTQRFMPFFDAEKHLVPRPCHVDFAVFGTVPLELYRQTKNKTFYDMGMRFADAQWTIPIDSPQVVKDAYQKFLDKGLTWQTRYWIDDMYMITMVQSKAFQVTGDHKYMDRAAHEMVVYLDTIQKENGLFYHAPDAPFFWGRGNGWMAAGMSELLASLSPDHPNRPAILASYRKMMMSLKEFQRKDGLWGQLIDKPESWVETSGSAMFTYALIMGVRNGWLDTKEYAPVARKAWLALVEYINPQGDISHVCEGTNRKNDYQYYLDRKQKTGDMHGQAPILWCAYALLKK
ncbi:glycoside hydrolase family 88 protein [Sphingobacterium sp. N143]|uniref:glycoside hydrolase family 88/105 protein n=1 Tax=Sphingobacterium sp. N143 TaxID=2746727 RepID=UPI0025767C15|nr:glycoside hydrolase family 88 protein [Sphingobacterium sp. N143]MDM1296214.1 glycoside hydrolase family 88 protein [Sphingobacterium sp. N143]